MVDLDDRAANDPENPPSTKGTRGRGSSPKSGVADTRSNADIGGGFFDWKPTLVDEESANSSVDDGYNDYTRPSPAGHSVRSDRFTK